MRTFLLAAPLLFAAPASAEVAFTCSADAFTTVGGFYGIGRGSVSLRVDEQYRPLDATIEYEVTERVTGQGKLQLSWAVPPGGDIAAASAPNYLRIPIWSQPPDSFSATVSIDDVPAATHRFRRTGEKVVVDLDATGWVTRGESMAAIISATDAPWLPDLRTVRTVSYALTAADGRTIGGEPFLLPDWRKLGGEVKAAMKAVEKQRKARRCDRTFVIERTD